MLREVSPQKCANAVLKVIAGSSQELVSSGPIRPLLALAELAPGLNKPILKRLASCADDVLEPWKNSLPILFEDVAVRVVHQLGEKSAKLGGSGDVVKSTGSSM